MAWMHANLTVDYYTAHAQQDAKKVEQHCKGMIGGENGDQTIN